MLSRISCPMTINALLTNRNTSAVSQLVNTLHRARTLHDCVVVTARATNLAQMRLHQLICLVKHRCHFDQPQLSQSKLGLLNVGGVTEIEEVPTDVVECEADIEVMGRSHRSKSGRQGTNLLRECAIPSVWIGVEASLEKVEHAGNQLIVLCRKLVGLLAHARSRLTTQAQRPGPRDAWIATWTRWPGSLQRMVSHTSKD